MGGAHANCPVYCKSMAHNMCKYQVGDILKCSCSFLFADRVILSGQDSFAARI